MRNSSSSSSSSRSRGKRYRCFGRVRVEAQAASDAGGPADGDEILRIKRKAFLKEE